VHVAAKNHNRKDTGKLINYAKGKFPVHFLEKMRNGDGETVDNILKKPFRADHDVYQTGSQENDEDHKRSLKNRGLTEQVEITVLGSDGTNDGQERDIRGEDVEVPNQDS